MRDAIFKKGQQMQKKLFSIEGAVALIILANFLIYLILLIYSHNNFFGFNEGDKGIMYQMYYNTIVHGDFFYSSVNEGFNIGWGNRYILVLFLPFMYLYPDVPTTFSVISTALLCLGALPVYWLATEVARSKKAGLLFVGLYFLYPSVGWLMLESVKEEIYILPFLLFAFYYMYTRSYSKSMFFLLLALICKHNMLLVVPMFAVYAYLEKYDTKWIIGPIALAAGWFVTFKYILGPYFGSLDNITSDFTGLTAGRYTWMGTSFTEVILTPITNPILLIQHLVTPENLIYLILLFIPLLGISLLKPRILLIGLPIFMQNLLATPAPMKMISWHYVSTLVFVILVAAICAFPMICREINTKDKQLFLTLIILGSIVCFLAFGPAIETSRHIENLHGGEADIIFSPLGISYDKKYAMQTAIDGIPDTASVIATSRFGQYIFKKRNFNYHDWGRPIDVNCDYYLLWASYIIGPHSPRDELQSFQTILDRQDLNIQYYDRRYIVLGTGEPNPAISTEDRTKLIILGYRFGSGVGEAIFDDTINDYVFFSSKQTHQEGYLVYGPYRYLPAGDYTIEYVIKAESIRSPDDLITTVDVYSVYKDGSTIIRATEDAKRDVYGRDLIEGAYTPIYLDVSIAEDDINREIEFRVSQPLKADLFIKEIQSIRRE